MSATLCSPRQAGFELTSSTCSSPSACGSDRCRHNRRRRRASRPSRFPSSRRRGDGTRFAALMDVGHPVGAAACHRRNDAMARREHAPILEDAVFRRRHSPACSTSDRRPRAAEARLATRSCRCLCLGCRTEVSSPAGDRDFRYIRAHGRAFRRRVFAASGRRSCAEEMSSGICRRSVDGTRIVPDADAAFA